ASLLVERPGRIEESIRRAVELRGITLERVRAELLDVDGHRRGQPLRAKDVEAERAAGRVGERRQPVLLARLVAGYERRTVLDRGIRPGKMRDAGLGSHLVLLLVDEYVA